MLRTALAGGFYFFATFAAAFVLGTVRVLAIAPRLGAAAAVALEIPLMLGASWLVSAIVTRRLAIPPHAASRLMMGAIGFALLMAAEFLLGLYGFGLGPDQQLAQLATPAGALGLMGQAAFALVPLLQGLQHRTD